MIRTAFIRGAFALTAVALFATADAQAQGQQGQQHRSPQQAGEITTMQYGQGRGGGEPGQTEYYGRQQQSQPGQQATPGQQYGMRGGQQPGQQMGQQQWGQQPAQGQAQWGQRAQQGQLGETGEMGLPARVMAARERLRQALTQAGLRNVRIVDAGYLIHAQTPEGDVVVLTVNPQSAMLTAQLGGRQLSGQAGMALRQRIQEWQRQQGQQDQQSRLQEDEPNE